MSGNREAYLSQPKYGDVPLLAPDRTEPTHVP
jgi:hypothetical protein